MSRNRLDSVAYLSTIPAGFQLERLSWWTIQFYASAQSSNCLFCGVVVDCLYVQSTFEASWCCFATNVKGVPIIDGGQLKMQACQSSAELKI